MTRSYLKMTNQSLVERAKAVPSKRRKTKITQEQIDVALAWIRDEVTTAQIAKVMDIAPSNVIARMGSWLREAFRSGIIKVVSDG